MTEQRPPRVFISYSHDTVEHQQRVLGLADRLRADGIDAEIDQYNTAPSGGWPLWCERQIEAADVVLMVCTETYHRRVSGDEERSKGLGVIWEAQIIRQLLYDAGASSDKFVPVLFSDTSPQHIPTPIRSGTRYVVDTKDGYEDLYRRLTGQPRLLRPALGTIRSLPTRTRQWPEGTMEAASSSPAPDSTPALDDAASARRGTPVRKLWSFLQQEKKRQVLGWTHPWIAFLIVFGMIVIAVGASTSAISDIVAFIAPWVTSDTRVSDGSQMTDGSSAVKPVAIADKRANNYKPVLVTPFENNTIGSRADSLRDILEDVVFSLGGHPVERKQLDNIVQELQFAQSSGLVDPTKAAAIGRMVGARYVLIGSIGKIDKEQKTFSGYNINTSTSVVTASVRVRLIDVETAAIVFSRSLTRSRSNLESKYGSSVGADMIVGALEDALKELYGDQALKRIIISAG